MVWRYEHTCARGEGGNKMGLGVKGGGEGGEGGKCSGH